jgi:hypothetical protein
VAKFVGLAEAAPGTTFWYGLVVMNVMAGGEDLGKTVQLVDPLPAQVDLVADTLGEGAVYDEAARSVTWQGQVPPGGSIHISFQVRLNAAAAQAGSVVNTVSITDALGRVRQASAATRVLVPTRSGMLHALTPTVAATPSPTREPSPTQAPAVEMRVPYVTCLVVTPDEPPLYYLVAGDALYRSVDAGATWSAEPLQGVPAGARVNTLAIDYRHPQTIYLGTDQGLYRRESSQGPWGLVNTLKVTALAVDFENPDVLWAGTPWSTELRAVIVRSADRGRTWGAADDGIELGDGYAWVGAILINPNDPNMMWAQVRPGTRHDWPQGLVFRGGRDGHWERLPLGGEFGYDAARGVAQSPDVCFVSGLAYDPNRNALYAGCDISYYNGDKRGYRLLRSGNADAPNSADVRWELASELAAAPQDRLGVNVVRPLAVDAREPRALFVFLDLTQDDGPSPGYRLLVSHDDGKSWSQMGLVGLPGSPP